MSCNRIKEVRTNKGLKQTDLAKIAGVSERTFIRYENGNTEPKQSALNAIAAALGVTTDYLMGRDTTSSPAPETKKIPVSQKADRELEGNTNGKAVSVLQVRVLNKHVLASAGRGNGSAIIDAMTDPTQDEVVVFVADPSLSIYGRHLYAISVEGDSMEPYIHDGEYAIFTDADLSDLVRGNVIIARIYDDIFIKGYLPRPDGYVLHSANPAYADIIVTASDDNAVIGRVVSIQGKSRKAPAVY